MDINKAADRLVTICAQVTQSKLATDELHRDKNFKLGSP